MTGLVAGASTWLHQIDPIALRLPEFELFGRAFAPSVHWYGVMYAIGFGLAWFLGRRRVAQGRLPGVDANAFADLLFYGMLGVVLGGRFGYVLFYGFPAFLDDPLMLLRIWEGGMSFHGGLLGVLVAMWWWSRRSCWRSRSCCSPQNRWGSSSTATRPSRCWRWHSSCSSAPT